MFDLLLETIDVRFDAEAGLLVQCTAYERARDRWRRGFRKVCAVARLCARDRRSRDKAPSRRSGLRQCERPALITQCVLALRASKRSVKKLQLNLNLKELVPSAVPIAFPSLFPTIPTSPHVPSLRSPPTYHTDVTSLTRKAAFDRPTRSAFAAVRCAEIQRAGRAAADRRHAAPSTHARPTGAGRADHDHVSAAQAEPSRAEPAA